jgi:hypothetical protein
MGESSAANKQEKRGDLLMMFKFKRVGVRRNSRSLSVTESSSAMGFDLVNEQQNLKNTTVPA